MRQSSGNIPFSPDEFQRRLADLMRHEFHAKPSADQAKAETSGESEEGGARGRGELFRFDHKPRDIKSYLDRFVIQQEEAKKVLSVALCDHYHHVQLALRGKAHPNYTKQNIILIGPTGVGKTYLIRSVADLIGVPFVKGDATKFSETGYVGGDVEDLVRELMRRADGDIEQAQYGIIYIDEIDKIAASANMVGRDVSGRGVQTNLLKLMEETEVPARAPNDIAGQIQAVMELQRGKRTANVINTKHILFIVSGAFDGLETIVRRRSPEASIGFASKGPVPTSTETLQHAQTRDFIEFGFEPEFIGRLPVRVVCQPLTAEDLFHILKDSEGSLLRQYEQDFAAYGIEVTFEQAAMQRMAERAAEEQTGARGLMTVCERIFRDLKFELPSTCVRRLCVNNDLVDNPRAALERLVNESRENATFQNQQAAHAFAHTFSETHGLKIRFTDEAAARLAALADSAKLSVPEFCTERFKDFQFGLKLVSQNTGQTEFLIGPDAVDEPDKVLSGWVVASYRKNS
jgi:ATP-dependent Clp protease ATP-binding subunit ClpX